jgi:hypothetical protein
VYGTASERIHGILKLRCEQSGMPQDVGMGQHAFFDEKAVITTAKLVSLFSAARSTRSHEKTEVRQARIGV